MNIKKNSVGCRNNIKKHGSIFHYDIKEGPMLVIVYAAVRLIPCRCSACLRKLAPPCNKRQDKYNQDR